MFQRINEVTKDYGVTGSIILYRDSDHKKVGLCNYLHTKLQDEIGASPILVCSSGAYAVYMGKAFPNNQILVNGILSPEYKAIADTMPNIKAIGAESKAYLLSQFKSPLFTEYYALHLDDILLDLGAVANEVSAFCDFSHSGATLAGFIQSGKTNWEFLSGQFGDNPKPLTHLTKQAGKFGIAKIHQIDTVALQAKIETAYPAFGNVFEATRSIAAAISWMRDNPDQTVLCYVGDSMVFGE